VKPEARYVELVIEKLADGGDGFGHVDGKACFVPLSAPGDRVRAKVAREKSSYLQAKIDRVLEPGPGRVEPRCAVYGECGGCSMMHLAKDVQIDAKEKALLRTVGQPVAVTRSPESFGYRVLARMRYRPGKGSGRFGFFGRLGRKVVDIDTCPILVTALDAVLGPLRNGLLARIGRPVDVRLVAGLDRPAVLVESSQLLPPAFYEQAAALVPGVFAGALVWSSEVTATIAGVDHVEVEGGDGEPLEAPVGGFGQANPGINRLLGATLGEWVAAGGYASAIELYAGAGNFTVAFAPHVKRVRAVELDRAACKLMRGNLERRGLARVEVEVGDAADGYRRHGKGAELVVLDPPRTGARELSRLISLGDHRSVIYISCDPAALRRDIGELYIGGYRPVRAQGFDMFPQTAHVEALVMLEKV
jgi:23S rRNA (uracil1939-C5)-methyltransferase